MRIEKMNEREVIDALESTHVVADMSQLAVHAVGADNALRSELAVKGLGIIEVLKTPVVT
jgi:hypothetical protein